MRLETKRLLEQVKSFGLNNDHFKACLQYIGQCEHLAKQYQQRNFLRRCKSCGVFPPSINNLKLPNFLNQQEHCHYLSRLKDSLLARMIRHTRTLIECSHRKLRFGKEDLPQQHRSTVVSMGLTAYSEQKAANKERLKKKFTWMVQKQLAAQSDQQQQIEHNTGTNNSTGDAGLISISPPPPLFPSPLSFQNFSNTISSDSREINLSHVSNNNDNNNEITSGFVTNLLDNNVPLKPEAVSLLSKGPKFNLSQKFDEKIEIEFLSSFADFCHQVRWRFHRQSSNSLHNTSNDKLEIPFEKRPYVPPAVNDELNRKLAIVQNRFLKILKREKQNSSFNKLQLNYKEKKCLKELKNDENMYIPSDKGGEFTVLSKSLYIKLGIEHLSDTNTYEKLKSDHTDKVTKQLRKIWSDVHIKQKLPSYVYQKLTPTQVKTQTFYHLIKTHKNGNKIRPIISGVGGPFDKIGWLIQKILSPLLKKVPAHLENTEQLINSLLVTPKTEMLNKIPISMDIVSMYTNIPIAEAIKISTQYLQRHKPNLFGLSIDNIKSLLDFILNNNVFEFNGNFYKQIRGLAMGSRIAPTLAILTLDYIEHQTIYADTRFNSLFYRRYVDDTLIIADNIEQAQQLLNFMNSSHSSIKFELELPNKDGELNILDTTITINQEGNIETQFFQKSAKKPLFIHFNSAQPNQMKKASIKAEKRRIENRCSQRSFFPKHTDQFYQKLKQNGYSSSYISSAITSSSSTSLSSNIHPSSSSVSSSSSSILPPIYISLPFISDKLQFSIRKCLNSMEVPIRIVNKSRNTLRSTLKKLHPSRTCNKKSCPISNDKLCFQNTIVYSIRCKTCNSLYIGSTKQAFHTRVSQHLSSSNSAIKNHMDTTHHAEFDYKVLKKCFNIKNMLFSEAILIKKMSPSMNRQHEMNDVLQFIF